MDDASHTTNLETQLAVLTERMAAADKATQSAFAASEKAIAKAEQAQSDYNARSNEFRSSLDDQNKLMSNTMIGRPEWSNANEDVKRKIEELGIGLGKKIDENREQLNEKADVKSVINLQKLVYMGVGMAILLSFLVPILITVLKQ
jgi:hypothetical protein